MLLSDVMESKWTTPTPSYVYRAIGQLIETAEGRWNFFAEMVVNRDFPGEREAEPELKGLWYGAP